MWFAFNLVSLNHWTQQDKFTYILQKVVICFQFSIFEPLDTTVKFNYIFADTLWFAFNLVSLNHWTQRGYPLYYHRQVVICFQFSIFEPLDTTRFLFTFGLLKLWFAFNLVSLNHWTQLEISRQSEEEGCDLLSI